MQYFYLLQNERNEIFIELSLPSSVTKRIPEDEKESKGTLLARDGSYSLQKSIQEDIPSSQGGRKYLPSAARHAVPHKWDWF